MNLWDFAVEFRIAGTSLSSGDATSEVETPDG